MDLIDQKDLEDLKNKGFVLKKRVLKDSTIDKIKSLILQNIEGKGSPDSHYPANLKSLLIKFLKLDFKKIISSYHLLTLRKKLNLDHYASLIFETKSELKMIDGYYNKKTNQDILPWHSDRAYSGAKFINTFNHPDDFSYKFFFYLTPVGPTNGCTSYFPESHKITYAVRSCIFNKEINYRPFWTLSELINFIHYEDNYKKIIKKLDNEDILQSFLKTADICLNNKKANPFDFTASPGDLLIFNETGIHRGSKPTLSDRVVLRYLYEKKNK